LKSLRATLAELLDCQRELEKNGSGEARVRVAEFIAHVRQESRPAPLQIEIVNAREIGATEKILRVGYWKNDGGLKRAYLLKRSACQRRTAIGPRKIFSIL
jgi:hypothetical protein